MKNFGLKFAIKCTEKQFKSSTFQDKHLSLVLEELGYDLTEFNFYPNKPYIVSHYKGQSNKISTSNTPTKEGRYVFEQWNPELFMALCSQLAGASLSVGEYFTTEWGSVHRVEELLDDHVRYIDDHSESKTLLKTLVSKSTIFDISLKFNSGKSITRQSEEGDTHKIQFLEEDVMCTNRKELLSVAEKIVTGKKTKTLEEMLTDSLDSIDKTITGYSDLAEKGRTNPGGAIEIQINNTKPPYQKDTTVIIKEASPIKKDFPGPMSFKDVLLWFSESSEVVLGYISKGSITCEVVNISYISKEFVVLEGEKPVFFENLFMNKESFLKYALSMLDI